MLTETGKKSILQLLWALCFVMIISSIADTILHRQTKDEITHLMLSFSYKDVTGMRSELEDLHLRGWVVDSAIVTLLSWFCYGRQPPNHTNVQETRSSAQCSQTSHHGNPLSVILWHVQWRPKVCSQEENPS